MQKTSRGVLALACGRKRKSVGLCIVAVVDDNELSYLYGGSIRKFQKYGGAHLLQWTMIQEAMKKGYENYNFYGVKPFPDNGVYVFKQGFRGHVEELVGTFALPIGLLGKLYLSRLKPLKFREVN